MLDKLWKNRLRKFSPKNTTVHPKKILKGKWL